MLNIFKLILPIIVPSWRFFDVIAPSPRIQYTLLDNENVIVSEWSEFRPRPRHMSLLTMLKHMLWNAKWNESLFMISCAERILERSPSWEQSEIAILKRIHKNILYDNTLVDLKSAASLQFILILLEKKHNEIVQTVFFQSRIMPINKSGSE